MFGRTIVGLVTALTVVAGSLAAQAAPADTLPSPMTDSAGFVVMKNQDTVAVERFEHGEITWRGTLAINSKKDIADTWSVVTAPDGSVPQVEVMESQKPPDPRMRAHVISRVRLIVKGDSVAVDEMTGHGMQTRLFGSETGVVPYLNLSFGMLEVDLRQAMITAKPDTAAGATLVWFFNLGGGQTARGSLKRGSANQATLTIGEIVMNLELAPDGKLLSVAIPAQGLRATRIP
jgi:hypothetical protein